MGSRTVWKIRTEFGADAVIHFYSHSGGESKFEDTKAALRAAEPRWDHPYGARVFISQIIGDQWAQEHGFGIEVGKMSDSIFEESYYDAVVDFSTQRVTLGKMEWSFEDFMSAEDTHLDLVEAYNGEGHA